MYDKSNTPRFKVRNQDHRGHLESRKFPIPDPDSVGRFPEVLWGWMFQSNPKSVPKCGNARFLNGLKQAPTAVEHLLKQFKLNQSKVDKCIYLLMIEA